MSDWRNIWVPATAACIFSLAAVVMALSSSAAQSTRPGWGSTPYAGGGSSGVTFRVWAPNASTVTVAGDFNGWSTTANPLGSEGTNGVWSADVPAAAAGREYKYVINGSLWKRDPRDRKVVSSASNSIVYDPNAFDWAGDNFAAPSLNDVVVYELHVGTFYDPNPSDSHPGTFGDAINKLDQLQELGISAVEVMPIAEFPTDYSWGYNPADPYAVENFGYGGPDGFKAFVRACHQRGMAVLLDTVHNHYGPSDLDLWNFDGWTGGSNGGGIYFYQDNGLCCTPYGSRPNYSRPQVRNYIQDNFRLWLDEYHVDGFRWDTPYYMMNYDSGFIPDAQTLIQQISSMIHTVYVGRLNFAEDSGWLSGVSGFDSTWDTYGFQGIVVPQLTVTDDSQRNMGTIQSTISGLNGGWGNILFTETHDSAGDLNYGSRLPVQIDGSDPTSYYARKRSTLGIVLALTSPGIPMLLEGQEMLTTQQFGSGNPLDWTRTSTYSRIVWLYRDLIRLRRNLDGLSSGLKGVNVNVFLADDTNKMIAYRRWSTGAVGDDVVVVANFSAVSRTGYTINFPKAGTWHAHLNSDSSNYSPDYSNFGTTTVLTSGGQNSAAINIAPYSVLIFSQVPPPEPPATPANLAASAVSINQIDLAWSASVGATSYIVKHGGNVIGTTSATDYTDSGLAATSNRCYTVAAANSGGVSADSTETCATAPFVLSGATNTYPGYLLSNLGMPLYAAVRGTVLYVATVSPGSNNNGVNDCFIFVTDQLLPSASASAPWAKAGQIAIAASKPYIGGESQNTFVGWFNAPPSSQVVKAATISGQMQGAIDLVQAFGSMPSVIYLSAAAYSTADGGSLVAQAPAGDGNGNIESNEFFAVPVASITDNNADGLFDNLDPAIGFAVRSVQLSTGSGFALTWTAVPGKTYQMMSCDNLGEAWIGIGPQMTASSGQTTLLYTDMAATNAPMRFYKVKAVNP